MNNQINTQNNLLDEPPIPVKVQKRLAETAAIKQLPKLIEAFQWNQKDRISVVGESIASAVEAHHPDVSKKIRSMFGKEMRQLAVKPERLLEFEEARHGFDAVILPLEIQRECMEIVAEHNRSSDLAAYGLVPRHKVLLHGAPGNGKTMLAEALAFELSIPFLRVKYGGLIDSHLGETGKNLQSIFEYTKTAPCVLFLDEFDGIGMDRNDNRDIGEMRRVTNQLLIAIERIPSSCVLVAATNADSLLDSALKRRFDFVIEVPTPTVELRFQCARKELSPSITPGHDVLHLADRIALMDLSNLSAVVDFCKRIRRDLVLNAGAGLDTLVGPA
ncbi:MAG: ATP-binding protein [bacterium]|nr:ATP-binding protein [bacterium]